ncbi:DDB1- and CUL4-associated factor 12 homolog isoform X2 [Dendroctonus ponderosae]|uniref:DDB1- and CUL4-associated factor 12 beta-propeller domain-containing protein n=1 Tax=Dendroctonus ponderosae TaxID=77166 RepID=A0AAR5PJM5_DENPD|nr:DDB1- and CUL4-associated factor 12 homolog isoform X2 [Dendroctonus ponderosae]
MQTQKMSRIVVTPVYGLRPPRFELYRIQERINKIRALKLLEQNRKTEKPEDFIIYDESDSDDEAELLKQGNSASYNFVDFVRHREYQTARHIVVSPEYGNRHILTHELFKENPINLGHVNKVFCSQWLSDRQVVFGTKCNKLMVYDVQTRKLDQIPSLISRSELPNSNEQSSGIHSVQLNPSKTLLATGAKNTCDIAVYRLPTLDPVCVGENGHKDWVFDACWLDDEFLVSGSRDTKLALWRITEDVLEAKSETPTHKTILPVVLKDCRNAQKTPFHASGTNASRNSIRAISFNQANQEFAALSSNGFIHVFDAQTFKQEMSRKLPSSQENVCMAVQCSRSVYAIGCKSYTLLLDTRTLQAVKKISSRYSGCGIRSASFQGDILTVGTGLGLVMFYDLIAGKYLESSINSSRTVILKVSKGYVFPDEEYMDIVQHVKYVPTIYTHCYDATGMRLFTAGGPLPATLTGNYAGLWQ